jgi:hypothetical protein
LLARCRIRRLASRRIPALAAHLTTAEAEPMHPTTKPKKTQKNKKKDWTSQKTPTIYKQ